MLEHYSVDVAPLLHNDYYLEIARQMIAAYAPSLPSARGVLFPLEGNDVIGLPEGDTSLARQLSESFNDKPDAYAVTAYSAIPVADCIRGFYAAQGTEPPPIIPISADRVNALDYFDRHDRNVNDPSKDEIKRLKSLLDGIKSIEIIDQFVETGRTLRYAGILAAKAGAQRVNCIQGRWYHDARKSDLDIANLTSKSRNFMYQIGWQACHLTARSY